MSGTRDWVLPDAEATTRLGAAIAPRLEPGETVAERVRRSHVDVVGLTAGTREGLDGLAQIIAAVRRNSRNPHVSIIIGGPAFHLHPERGNRLDADAIITNGASAPALAERLVAAQKRPR